MGKNKLPADILERIEENKRLHQSPGLGKLGASFWSLIGFNSFWVVLIGSLILTMIFFELGMNKEFSKLFLGWLYR